MTLAKFVVIIAISLTTIAVALIVGAVILMEKEKTHGGVVKSKPVRDDSKPVREESEWVFPLNRVKAIYWVPAEERLPEENKRVLVTAEWDGETKQVTETRRLPGDGKTRVWTIGYGGIVVAWAELPEPYKK